MATATSPGMTHMMQKINRETPIRVTTARRSRRTMYCFIAFDLSPA
jgi:hypothetical protein